MARGRTKLERAAAEIGALALTGDVRNEDQASRAVASLVRESGGIDILVNNAGFGYAAPLVDIDADRFQQIFATNVTGSMLMAREAAKHFIKQNSGNLISIASASDCAAAAAVPPIPDRSLPCAA